MSDFESESKLSPKSLLHNSLNENPKKSRSDIITGTAQNVVKGIAKGAGTTLITTRRAAKGIVKRTIQGGVKTSPNVLGSFLTANGGDDGDQDRLKSNVPSDSVQTSESKAVLSVIEKLSQKKGTNTENERFKVFPTYAYPNTKFNREELRQEMNKPSSYYHDLRPRNEDVRYVGSFFLEVLQCFGIPRHDLLKETSAFCLAACGPHAFRTDVMPPVANPMWLSKMRRACVFPLVHAFARVYLGVFAYKADSKDIFIGRIVMDMARLRPGSTYDITLPLRLYSNVYSRQKRGAIRIRCHLEWHNERQALLSYLPLSTNASSSSSRRGKRSSLFQFNAQPHDSVTIRCCDNRAFQNVARVVHGNDLPGKFSMKLVQATIREINFIRVHVLRYTRKQQMQDLIGWKYPLISGFVFVAWMHSIWVGNIRYVPGHVLTYLLLQVWKNYALYVVDGQHDNGFLAPTYEEMLKCLIVGGRRANKTVTSYCIEPLSMERKEEYGAEVESALQFFDDSTIIEGDPGGDGLMDNSMRKFSLSTSTAHRPSSLFAIANAFRDGVPRTERKDSSSFFQKSGSSRVFAGTAAVDFMVSSNIVKSREEAVEIGIRLQKELRLFEHVTCKYDFKDAEHHYVFLNFDSYEYDFKTHRPWFRNFFRLIGFHKAMGKAHAFWEFPFATGADHPRFTVKDSLVIRSKEARNLLQTLNQEDEMEDVDALGVSSVFGNRMNRSVTSIVAISDMSKQEQSWDNKDDSGSNPHTFSDDVDIDVDLLQSQGEYHEIGEMVIEQTGNVEVIALPKPPNQDINVVKKSDKKIADQMDDTRYNVHRLFGHIFHDKSYRVSLIGDGQRKESREFRRLVSTSREKRSQARSLRGLRKSKVPNLIESFEDPKQSRQLALSSRKDEFDRLLSTGKYSNSNLVVSKVATIIQPIVEIAHIALRVFRALFNVFTWRDPFLTFWLVSLGSILVVVLHLFPWRIFLGVAGICYTGPQNWVVRFIKERRSGISSSEMDVIVRKRQLKEGLEKEEGMFGYFTSMAADNRPVNENLVDKSEYKEVAVPYTPLNYRRFYDWPPEAAYARVWSCGPPENDPIAAHGGIENGDFHVVDESQTLTNDNMRHFPGDKDRDKNRWTKTGLKVARGVQKVGLAPNFLKQRHRGKVIISDT